MTRSRVGFTLLEIVITIAIVAVLSTMAVVAYRSFQERSALQVDVRELVTTLQQARELTLASSGDVRYGVYVEADKYTLFSGDTYSQGSPGNVVHTLDDSNEVYAGAGSAVLFDRVRGTTAGAGDIGLRRIANPSITETVQINATGQAGLTSTHAPTGTARASDFRHTHFAINSWSFRGVTTPDLILKFGANPSSPESTASINMETYFDTSPPNSFDWSDTVTVGGVDQTLRISTHALDAFSFTLSVERGMDENTKPLQISINDGVEKVIVFFPASGAAQVNATYGGTITVE